MDHDLVGETEAGNSRNGSGTRPSPPIPAKVDLAVPRDRQSPFDPQLIARTSAAFPASNEKIIALDARGMSTREIVGHVRDLYGVEVSPDLIGAGTDAVLEEVATWQARPLEPVYPPPP